MPRFGLWRRSCLTLAAVSLCLATAPLPLLAEDDLEAHKRQARELLELLPGPDRLEPQLPPETSDALAQTTVSLQPGVMTLFEAPDVASPYKDCFGLASCEAFSRNDASGKPTLAGVSVDAGLFGGGLARMTWRTPYFSVPGASTTGLETDIAVTVGYQGELYAIVAGAGSARADILISTYVWECTAPYAAACKVISGDEILNQACDVTAYASADQCVLAPSGNGSARLPILMTPGRYYVLSVEGTATAAAGGLSGAFSTFDGPGLFWRRVTVSIKPDLLGALDSLRESVASLERSLAVVSGNSAQALALGVEQMERLDALEEMLRAEGDRTLWLLEASDAEWATGVETSLLRGESLVGLFLPESLGGDLPSVRELVSERIGQCDALGVDTAEARQLLAQADRAMAEAKHREALRLLARAYQRLTPDSAVTRTGSTP